MFLLSVSLGTSRDGKRSIVLGFSVIISLSIEMIITISLSPRWESGLWYAEYCFHLMLRVLKRLELKQKLGGELGTAQNQRAMW